MDKKKIRIKDIAQLAGVSVGTVDRVIHKRGRVSDEALEKVLKTLHEIDYKPNLIARTLGSSKTYRIAALIPDPSLDEYWHQSFQGINHAQEEWAQYDFRLETFFFNLYDRNSFKKVAEAVLESEPDGVLISPVFYHEVLPFFELLKDRNIPYVLFNTNIPEVQPLTFIGQDLFESGKVGAELLHLQQKGAGTFAILHINENSLNSVHLLEKEKGFKEYFRENAPDARVLVLELNSQEEASVEKAIGMLLQNTELAGILVTTSKGASLVSDMLQAHGKDSIRLVGYDLLEENIKYLKAGIIDFLINQNPKRQAFLGISHLANYLLLRKEPPQQDLFPLEIITKQNLRSYLESGIH
ncbi:LacI family transcriptional regulator [Pontibacter ummariensis]|uniref:Transcriptional regulator, LacI family n=1 Tax=Pontibacter ummariensis TaxID=1610492 RepID=A0A239G230_9BACT|nr:substrate-binding domain-containing protein [Pontibacter ummariensis]PRY11678.1 LacI family transcriptional regulator [Pontibacter ummariensis]SNS63100.1 transcriptional regulator, LacI family [Pontibacter ummariensis]